VACVGEKRNSHRYLVTTSEIERTLGRTRRRWEDNRGFELKEDRTEKCGMN